MVALRHEEVEDATNDKPYTTDEQSYNMRIRDTASFTYNIHAQSKTPTFNNTYYIAVKKYSPIHMTKIPAI